jgi:hypothetical protein
MPGDFRLALDIAFEDFRNIYQLNVNSKSKTIIGVNMKKILLLTITVVLSYSSAFAQMGYDPFVSEVRGDTLLVKDYY